MRERDLPRPLRQPSSIETIFTINLNHQTESAIVKTKLLSFLSSSSAPDNSECSETYLEIVAFARNPFDFVFRLLASFFFLLLSCRRWRYRVRRAHAEERRKRERLERRTERPCALNLHVLLRIRETKCQKNH